MQVLTVKASVKVPTVPNGSQGSVMITRRGFFAAIAATLVADPERLLWVPGAKKIFLPPTKVYEPEPLFEAINMATLAALRREVLADNFFVDAVWHKLLREDWGGSFSGGTSIADSFERPQRLDPGLVLPRSRARARQQG